MCRDYMKGAQDSYASSCNLLWLAHKIFLLWITILFNINNMPPPSWLVGLGYMFVRSFPNSSALEVIKIAKLVNFDFNDFSAHLFYFPLSSHWFCFATLHHCSLMFLEFSCCPHLPRIFILGLHPRAKHHSHSCDVISCVGTKTIRMKF